MAEQLASTQFGRPSGGEDLDAFTLEASGGLSLQAITLGGIVTHLRVPDRRGDVADVVLGFADPAAYLWPHPYFGAIAGRVAGRISGARFSLDGQHYPLACNDPPNHLHGGERGFDKRIWKADRITRQDGAASLRMSRVSLDGEEGYPGTVHASVTYTVTPANEFMVETEATTDRATPFSLTHHSYFNLAGEGSGSVEGHELQIFAGTSAPADAASGLMGRRDPVAGNDFRSPRRLADAIPHLSGRHGDLYFVDRDATESNASPALVDAARLVDPVSGRVLTVRTTEACIQLYTGVGLDGSLVGKSGRRYGQFGGLCLECEGYPDGANRPELGDIILRPGAVHRQTTIYAFSTM